MLRARSGCNLVFEKEIQAEVRKNADIGRVAAKPVNAVMAEFFPCGNEEKFSAFWTKGRRCGYSSEHIHSADATEPKFWKNSSTNRSTAALLQGV